MGGTVQGYFGNFNSVELVYINTVVILFSHIV